MQRDPMPVMPPAPGAPEAPKKKQHSKTVKIVAGVLVSFALVGTGAALGGGSNTPATQAAPSEVPASLVPVEPEAEAEPIEESSAPLSVDDLELSLKTTEKHCYGSAGCNVTVEPELSWPESEHRGELYDVTYRITGDEYGPITETLTILGNGKFEFMETWLSTISAGTPIDAEIIRVKQTWSTW